MDPLPVPPHVFALAGERLRYCCFPRLEERSELAEYHQADLASDAFLRGPLGGPLRDAAAFTDELRRLVARVSAPVREASLVLPDAWLRVTFLEGEELPRSPVERDEVLRWKLRRLVPFRVDELRLHAVPVTPLPGQEEPCRFLLGFAIEALLAQLEGAFTAAGIQLGLVSSQSLSLIAAFDGSLDEGLTALALVEPEAYTLVFTRGGEPVLHRHKPLQPGTSDGALAALVPRDLRLTRTFLDEHLPGPPLARCLVWAPDAAEARWCEWVGEGLGAVPVPLGAEHLPVVGMAGAASWKDLAPMLGAARREVA